MAIDVEAKASAMVKQNHDPSLRRFAIECINLGIVAGMCEASRLALECEGGPREIDDAIAKAAADYEGKVK